VEANSPKGRQFKSEKIILVALCLVALIAFLIPAISLETSFMGMSTNTTFGIATIFDSQDNPFAGMDMPGIQQRDMRDFLDLFGDDNPFADVGTRLVISVGAYFITAVLLVVFLICTLLGKLTRVSTVLLVIGFALFVYAGYMISTVPEHMQAAFANLLGFLAMFIDISNIINISLGIGYWLTLVMMGCMVLIKLVGCIRRHLTKDKIAS